MPRVRLSPEQWNRLKAELEMELSFAAFAGKDARVSVHVDWSPRAELEISTSRTPIPRPR